MSYVTVSPKLSCFFDITSQVSSTYLLFFTRFMTYASCSSAQEEEK